MPSSYAIGSNSAPPTRQPNAAVCSESSPATCRWVSKVNAANPLPASSAKPTPDCATGTVHDAISVMSAWESLAGV